MLLLYESATIDSEALLAKLHPYVNDIEDWHVHRPDTFQLLIGHSIVQTSALV